MKIKYNAPLILASTSWGRNFALEKAGVKCTATKPLADEEAYKEELSKLSIHDQTLELGRIKGEEVSRKNPDAYIICGDQICEINGKAQGKPQNIQNAVEVVYSQSGQTTTLHTSVLVMKNGQVVWSHVDKPKVTMRNYSMGEARAYVHSDPSVVHCAGGIKIEDSGMHLAQKVDGDMFSIIGLPIYPLLAQLYKMNILEIEMVE